MVGEILAFPEELVRHAGVGTGFVVVVGFFLGVSTEEVDGGEVGGVVVVVGEGEEGVERRKRV